MDEEELEELEDKLEFDYQIGEDIKEKVCPHINVSLLAIVYSRMIVDHSSCHRLLYWQGIGVRG